MQRAATPRNALASLFGSEFGPLFYDFNFQARRWHTCRRLFLTRGGGGCGLCTFEPEVTDDEFSVPLVSLIKDPVLAPSDHSVEHSDFALLATAWPPNLDFALEAFFESCFEPSEVHI